MTVVSRSLLHRSVTCSSGCVIHLHLQSSSQFSSCNLEVTEEFSTELAIIKGVFDSSRKTQVERIRIYTMRTPFLPEANAMLSVINSTYEDPGLHVSFSKKESYSTLNETFISDGLEKMLEDNYYPCLDKIFPFSP